MESPPEDTCDLLMRISCHVMPFYPCNCLGETGRLQCRLVRLPFSSMCLKKLDKSSWESICGCVHELCCVLLPFCLIIYRVIRSLCRQCSTQLILIEETRLVLNHLLHLRKLRHNHVVGPRPCTPTHWRDRDRFLRGSQSTCHSPCCSSASSFATQDRLRAPSTAYHA